MHDSRQEGQLRLEKTETDTFVILHDVALSAWNSDANPELLYKRNNDPLSQMVCNHVQRFCETYHSDLSEMTDDVTMSFKESASLMTILRNCVVPVLDHGSLRKGRIIAVIALYANVCRQIFRTQKMLDPDQQVRFISEVFGKFLNERIGKWLIEQGGWGCFENGYEAPAAHELQMPEGFSRLTCFAVMGIGMGTLLGFLAVR